MAKLIRYSVDEDGIADYTPEDGSGGNKYCTWCGTIMKLYEEGQVCEDCLESDDYIEHKKIQDK
jgi:hypothetical protein